MFLILASRHHYFEDQGWLVGWCGWSAGEGWECWFCFLLQEPNPTSGLTREEEKLSSNTELGETFPPCHQVVLAAVNQNGATLMYAATCFQGDAEVVLAAVQQDVGALVFAAPRLLGNRDFLIDAVKLNAGAIAYASEALRADRDFVLTAVRQRGYVLRYASVSLKADREVVLGTTWSCLGCVLVFFQVERVL